jgi:hypothetical protein
MRRWTEEVLLLKEEMCRIPITLRWKAQWWEDRCVVEEFSRYHAEGARAYALRQAKLFRDIADKFEKQWAGLDRAEEVESIPQPAPAPDAGDDEKDEEDDNWVAAESEGERGLEGEDEEGSVGDPDDDGDDL